MRRVRVLKHTSLANLGGDGDVIQERDSACDALELAVGVLGAALSRVIVLPEIERAVAASSHKDITILRQMRATPDGRFVSLAMESS